MDLDELMRLHREEGREITYADLVALPIQSAQSIIEDFITRFKRHVGGDGEFWLHELEDFAEIHGTPAQPDAARDADCTNCINASLKESASPCNTCIVERKIYMNFAAIAAAKGEK